METSPDHIGRFRVLGVLGRGAMGVVYKAHDPRIERTVAIKLVRADLLDGDSRAQSLARFRNEARLAGRCVHPHIVAIHDYAEHEGNPFLVLEYVEGRDLGRAFPRGTRLAPATLRRIALPVLDALGHAHGLGVIHRDIKPANILLADKAGLKVTDFGISRALATDATMTSALVGTPCYMSPEQCLGGAVDARSDLFSFGCVLYELLAGRRAFAADTPLATMHRLIHEPPAPLSDLRPELPPALVEVVERALRKRPEDRFADAGAMARALEALPGDIAADAAGDTTVVTAPPSFAGTLDPPTLTTIERRLAHHVGPMARHHLRHALAASASPEDLCARLVALLPDAGEQRSFTREMRDLLSTGGLDEATIATVRSALTQVLGPVAPLLLRDLLARSPDLDTLMQGCLRHIPRTAEQESFRRLLGPVARRR
ncbi:Non-specific serine/threonine protein kinase [Rhodovastum atsumiense]|uniref:non-specific serine/threonine protein kinase n=1 Tax=Rhodovastum atsumiense TaxID=504468 RepID=A0A5M6IZD1_9PROT|nr:serine/threonine-protein kinase [Rhodovastum atsumiense]KAA5612735.1 serine/threonine protein kinase [Rhodovastum atsumiense]CAH2602707.1 Non-specific serine/threonine protein kinase [Rhodovastum atsumiense]